MAEHGRTLCDYIVEWAIQCASDVVLEPSCGEAAFMLATGARLQAFGGTVSHDFLHGVELHEESAVAAISGRMATWPRELPTK